MDKFYDYIAYKGTCFTIEWYFNNKTHSEALAYYQKLTTSERIKVLKLFKKLGDFGEIKDKTKFISEVDKIYAFKP